MEVFNYVNSLHKCIFSFQSRCFIFWDDPTDEIILQVEKLINGSCSSKYSSEAIVIRESHVKGSRSTDQRYARDNRLMTPKSSHRRSRLAPQISKHLISYDTRT